ncbi:MAG: hypothetical protein ACK5L0_01700 [Candidatus Fimivivens sp.]
MAILMMITMCAMPTFALEDSPSESGINIVGQQSSDTSSIENHSVTTDVSNIDANEALVREFVQSTGDWDKWVSFYTSSARQMYEDFISNGKNVSNNVGILTATAADVVSIEQIDNMYAPRFFELADFYESEDNYETYLVGMDMKVKEDTEYFYNGINYKLVVLVNNGGDWEIGGQSGAPVEVMVKSEGAGINEALEKYRKRVQGDATITPFGVGYGLLTPGSTPTSIKVYYDGTVYTPTFSTFVKNATTNEIGNMGYDAEAVKANVLAVKMCGWWCKVAQYRDSYGADIMYGDVAYKPNTTIAQSVTNAYNSVGSMRCVSSSGTGSKLFYTAYFAGDYDDDGEESGELRQNGSDYLATELGYDYKEILHYYYDNSDYNNPNVGTVRIY